jgi:NAD(P)-dependent dehydrogenase (short-subunit alcohol dehydrogenase family)
MSQQAPLALVVGAGPGVGRAVATRFGQEGFRVALVARRGERLRRLAARLASAGCAVVTATADAADPDRFRAALDGLIGEHGAPQVLVYNAAGASAGRPTLMRPAGLQDAFAVNVVGPLVAAQAVLPDMRAHGRGTVLVTGDGVALDPRPEDAPLAITKAAQRALVLALAKEVEPHGVHVATVTVMGDPVAGTPFSPDAIAETFWDLHLQPSGAWSSETIFTGRIE